MKGVKQGIIFDTNKIKKGLPIRWRIYLNEENRFGLVKKVREKEITILAIVDGDFKSVNYRIRDIVDFELLGKWNYPKNTKIDINCPRSDCIYNDKSIKKADWVAGFCSLGRPVQFEEVTILKNEEINYLECNDYEKRRENK